MISNTQIIKSGIWSNNPAIMQLLGLCPLLAVSNTAISALALGVATVIVLALSNTLIATCKNYINYNLRIPYFMLIIASIVTCVILLLKAMSYQLYQSLGVYLALITTNCVILGRVEAFAYKNNIKQAFLDGLFSGVGFSLILLLMGSFRELIGQGTLFSNAEVLFGHAATNITVTVTTQDNSFLLALLPPGAFLTLGLLIAIKNSVKNLKNKNKIDERSTTLYDIREISTKKS